MTISINGKQIQISDQSRLVDHLPESNPQAPFSIALNCEFVPRSQYEKIVLKEGDEIDIVSPVGGG
jgi:sulfur carrier protein